MGVSIGSLFNRSYHKVPRKVDIYLKITGAADVEANGFTVNYGTDLVSSVVRQAEGVIDITFKFPINNLLVAGIIHSLKTHDVNITSITEGATPVIRLTSVVNSDHSTATDLNAGVLYLHAVGNLSQSDMK